MDKVIEKLVKQIQSMNTIAKKVIIYGFKAFLICLFASLILAIANKYLLGSSYIITANSTDIFKASFSVLAIVVMGGLFMDYISRGESQ